MTIIIIVVTCICSIIAFYNKDFFYKTQFNAYQIHKRGEWYRFFSHAVIHADWLHLIFNMYVLFSFGKLLEFFYKINFGEKATLFYVLLYLGAIATSSIPSYEKHKNNSWYNAVGASGAVSAVVFAGILFSPVSEIGFIFIPFGIPAFIFGILYLIYSYYMAKKESDYIAHDAHFFGALFGIMFTLILDREIGKTFINIIMEKYFE